MKRVNENVYVEISLLYVNMHEVPKGYESSWETCIFEKCSLVVSCVELLDMRMIKQLSLDHNELFYGVVSNV